MSTDYAKVFDTARARVFHVLEDCEWHTWRKLRNAGGIRYSARLLELKREGYEIESQDLPVGPGKMYRLVYITPGTPQTKRVKIFMDEDVVESLLMMRGIPWRARGAINNALASFRENKGKL